MTTEKVEITNEHLQIMREKYNCKGLTDDDIIKCMLAWERMRGGAHVNVLEFSCFPNFQTVLDNEKKH